MTRICRSVVWLAGFLMLWGGIAQANDYVPGQMVCRVNQTSYIDTINAEYGTSLGEFLPDIGSYLLHYPDTTADIEQLAATISQQPYIIYCGANYLLDAPEPVQGSQPFIDFQQEGTYEGQKAATSLAVETAQATATGEGVKVAVIDVGVNAAHPIIAGACTDGYDFVDDDANPNDEPGGRASGHGTFVAGVIKLVAPDADIAPYRVLDTAGRGDGFTVARAILQAVEDGARVINLSMVMTGNHGAIADAIEYARNNDVLIVAAAGNDATDIDRFPARHPLTLSVAAVDSLEHLADFSSYGSEVDICAPGTQIYAPFGDTLFAWWNGTSFAAPFATGQAALLLDARPTTDWPGLTEAMTITADNIDADNPGFDGMLGYGLISPTAALAHLSGQICGDVNGDGQGPNLSDITVLVNFLFLTYEMPLGVAVADVDGSGQVALTDLTLLVNHIFVTGAPLTCGQ